MTTEQRGRRHRVAARPDHVELRANSCSQNAVFFKEAAAAANLPWLKEVFQRRAESTEITPVSFPVGSSAGDVRVSATQHIANAQIAAARLQKSLGTSRDVHLLVSDSRAQVNPTATSHTTFAAPLPTSVLFSPTLTILNSRDSKINAVESPTSDRNTKYLRDRVKRMCMFMNEILDMGVMLVGEGHDGGLFKLLLHSCRGTTQQPAQPAAITHASSTCVFESAVPTWYTGRPLNGAIIDKDAKPLCLNVPEEVLVVRGASLRGLFESVFQTCRSHAKAKGPIRYSEFSRSDLPLRVQLKGVGVVDLMAGESRQERVIARSPTAIIKTASSRECADQIMVGLLGVLAMKEPWIDESLRFCLAGILRQRLKRKNVSNTDNQQTKKARVSDSESGGARGAAAGGAGGDAAGGTNGAATGGTNRDAVGSGGKTAEAEQCGFLNKPRPSMNLDIDGEQNIYCATGDMRKLRKCKRSGCSRAGHAHHSCSINARTDAIANSAISEERWSEEDVYCSVECAAGE